MTPSSDKKDTKAPYVTSDEVRRARQDMCRDKTLFRFIEMWHQPSDPCWRQKGSLKTTTRPELHAVTHVRPTVNFEPGSLSTAARSSIYLTMGYPVTQIGGKEVRRGHVYIDTYCKLREAPKNANSIKEVQLSRTAKSQGLRILAESVSR